MTSEEEDEEEAEEERRDREVGGAVDSRGQRWSRIYGGVYKAH